jgi:hypothetical protein
MTRFEEVVLGLMLLQIVVQILSLFRKSAIGSRGNSSQRGSVSFLFTVAGCLL